MGDSVVGGVPGFYSQVGNMYLGFFAFPVKILLQSKTVNHFHLGTCV